MAKYHISLKTGRPNICQAHIKACPVGGEHFDTKEQARASIEKKAAEENSVMPDSLSKNKVVKAQIFNGQKIWSKLSDSDKRSLREYLKVADEIAAQKPVKKAILPTIVSKTEAKFLKNNMDETNLKARTQRGILAGIESAAEYVNAGCAGCQPPYNDYCRCGEYTGNFSPISAKDIGRNVASYVLNRNSVMYPETKNEAAEIFAKIANAHSLHDTGCYTVVSVGDYYGEVLDRIDISKEGKERLDAFSKTLIDILNSV